MFDTGKIYHVDFDKPIVSRCRGCGRDLGAHLMPPQYDEPRRVYADPALAYARGMMLLPLEQRPTCPIVVGGNIEHVPNKMYTRAGLSG